MQATRLPLQPVSVANLSVPLTGILTVIRDGFRNRSVTYRSRLCDTDLQAGATETLQQRNPPVLCLFALGRNCRSILEVARVQ